MLVRANKWEREAIDKEEKLKRVATEINSYTKHVTELKRARRQAEKEIGEEQKKFEATVEEAHKEKAKVDLLIK